MTIRCYVTSRKTPVGPTLVGMDTSRNGQAINIAKLTWLNLTYLFQSTSPAGGTLHRKMEKIPTRVGPTNVTQPTITSRLLTKYIEVIKGPWLQLRHHGSIIAVVFITGSRSPTFTRSHPHFLKSWSSCSCTTATLPMTWFASSRKRNWRGKSRLKNWCRQSSAVGSPWPSPRGEAMNLTWRG